MKEHVGEGWPACLQGLAEEVRHGPTGPEGPEREPGGDTGPRSHDHGVQPSVRGTAALTLHVKYFYQDGAYRDFRDRQIEVMHGHFIQSDFTENPATGRSLSGRLKIYRSTEANKKEV